MKSRRLVLVGLIPALLLAGCAAVTVNYLARVHAKQTFVEALKSNDTTAVLNALAHGADPNILINLHPQTFWQAFFRRKSCYGCPPTQTALERAAQNNNLPIAQALIRAGAVIDNNPYCGRSELDYAERNKNTAMIAFLEKAGARKDQLETCL